MEKTCCLKWTLQWADVFIFCALSGTQWQKSLWSMQRLHSAQHVTWKAKLASIWVVSFFFFQLFFREMTKSQSKRRRRSDVQKTRYLVFGEVKTKLVIFCSAKSIGTWYNCFSYANQDLQISIRDHPWMTSPQGWCHPKAKISPF